MHSANGNQPTITDTRAQLSRFLYEQILAKLPYAEGARIRHRWLRRTASLGANAYIAENVHIVSPAGLQMGERASVAPDAILDCRGGLTIGDSSMVGIQAIVLTSSHTHASLDVPMRDQGLDLAPVRIGADVWIGARAIILPGVTIGAGAIVGAGAVVTADVEAYSIVAGVPARVLRTRIRAKSVA